RRALNWIGSGNDKCQISNGKCRSTFPPDWRRTGSDEGGEGIHYRSCAAASLEGALRRIRGGGYRRLRPPVRSVGDQDRSRLRPRRAPVAGVDSRLHTGGVRRGQLAIIHFAAIATVAVAVMGAIASYIESYLTTRVGQWVMHDLRQTLYHHIQRLSLSFYDRTKIGDLISRVTTDVDAIQNFVST